MEYILQQLGEKSPSIKIPSIKILVSDDLAHTKYSVFIFLEYILKHLGEKFPSIKILNVFSDGAGSQFKQRFFFSNLHNWEQDHHLKLPGTSLPRLMEKVWWMD